MMVCLLLSAYGVGVFSSRKMAWACERHLAFMALVGQDRPDFRPISDVRTLPLEAFKAILVQVIRLAGAAGLVQLGNVSTRHQAMSDQYRPKEVERLREDIEALVTQRTPSGSAEPQRQRNANGRARHVEAKPRNRWRRPPTPRPRAT